MGFLAFRDDRALRSAQRTKTNAHKHTCGSHTRLQARGPQDTGEGIAGHIHDRLRETVAAAKVAGSQRSSRPPHITPALLSSSYTRLPPPGPDAGPGPDQRRASGARAAGTGGMSDMAEYSAIKAGRQGRRQGRVKPPSPLQFMGRIQMNFW